MNILKNIIWVKYFVIVVVMRNLVMLVWYRYGIIIEEFFVLSVRLFFLEKRISFFGIGNSGFSIFFYVVGWVFFLYLICWLLDDDVIYKCFVCLLWV